MSAGAPLNFIFLSSIKNKIREVYTPPLSDQKGPQTNWIISGQIPNTTVFSVIPPNSVTIIFRNE